MNFEEKYRYALEHSKIHRYRQSNLFTFGTTRLPYVLAARSSINSGESIIRRGEIVTEKPSIMLQNNEPSFSGFSDNDGDAQQLSVLFGRRFHLPAMRYRNDNASMDLSTKNVTQVINESLEALDRENNLRTAVISGPEDCWQFSLIIYAGEMMQRSAPGNIREMIEHNKLQFPGGGQPFG